MIPSSALRNQETLTSCSRQSMKTNYWVSRNAGAISLAIEDVHRSAILPKPHKLDFIVAETYGEEKESILQTALLWKRNVSAYIGPQETCVHEAKMASSFRRPIISYVLHIPSLLLRLHWVSPNPTKFPQVIGHLVNTAQLLTSVR